MKLLLIGGGGHSISVIDVIKELDNIDIVGIIDSKDKVGEYVNGIKVVGTDDDLPGYLYSGINNAFITIGSTDVPNRRARIYKLIKHIGFNLPIIISKTAIVSKNVIIGSGSFIGKGAIINCNSKIGENCIINTGAIIEHDCKVDDNVHIAPGVTISGAAMIERLSHIGTNATIIQGVTVGEGSLIGAGSVVVKDFKGRGYGNPCREVMV